jgi:hypothetical protein
MGRSHFNVAAKQAIPDRRAAAPSASSNGFLTRSALIRRDKSHVIVDINRRQSLFSTRWVVGDHRPVIFRTRHPLKPATGRQKPYDSLDELIVGGREMNSARLTQTAVAE